MPDVSLPTQLVRASLRQTGEDPTLQTSILDATAVPTPGGVAYDMSGKSRALVRAALCRNGPLRTTVWTAPTFDAASTYVITVGGVSETVATPADENTLWVTMASQLTGSLSSAYTVTVPSGGSATSLTVVGPAAPVTFSSTGGSPVLAMQTEYVTARLRVYARPTVQDLGARAPSDAVELAMALANGLKEHCGSPMDYAIGPDGANIENVDVTQDEDILLYLTDLDGFVTDSCPGTAPNGLTYATPIAYAMPGIKGAT